MNHSTAQHGPPIASVCRLRLSAQHAAHRAREGSLGTCYTVILVILSAEHTALAPSRC